MSISIEAVASRAFTCGKWLGLAAATMLAAPAMAQQDDEPMIFEEIVVLATKRAQDIMQVPVAVSTLSGAQIEEAGIKDVWDLQQNVPGLIVGRSQTATTSNFAIRGIGSTSNNFGVESSVGLYVDGVYRSRQSSLINDLVDVEAVEVLRGPQGTLFGKNTAAGAILIRSVRPSQDRDAFVDLTVGDYGLVKVSAATNIPINDDWAFRGTVYSSNADGYIDDLNRGKDQYNDKDRMGVRLQFANDLGGDFNARIIADYSEINETCCVAVFRVDSLYYRGSIDLSNQAGISPGSDAAALALGGTVYTNYPYPQPLLDALTAPPPFGQGFPGTIVTNTGFEDYKTALNYPPVSENEDMGLSVDLEWLLDNDRSFKSITSVRSFETLDFIDGDFSDLDVFTRTNVADVATITQEFQLSGEFGSGSNYVLGAYYFDQKIDQETDTTGGIFFGPYLGILNPILGPPNNPESLQFAIEQLRAGLVGSPLEGAVAPSTAAFPTGVTSFDIVEQDQEAWAVFGQVDFSLSDRFILTLGARYTDESKGIDATYTQTANGPPPDLAAIEAALIGASQGDFSGILSGALVPVTEPNVAWGSYLFDPLAPRPDVAASLEDDQTTGTAKLTFFPNEDTMLYLAYATGYKSGGTNTDRINPAFDQIFGAETSESFEVGLKGEVGNVRYVLTYYDTSFEDFQANSFTGTGFNLQNAGDVAIDGIELELLWRPTDTTEVQAFYAHNEGTYESFEAGTAWDTWVVHEGLWMGQGDPGCDGPLDPANRPQSCSRTGDPIAYNPEDRAFVGITQDFHLSGNTTMFLRGEYTYISDQYTDGDLDPFTLQDSVELVNLRLGFHFDNIGSTLTFWGRNITDERYYHGSADVPVTEDKMFSYPSEPATWGITFNKKFD